MGAGVLRYATHTHTPTWYCPCASMLLRTTGTKIGRALRPHACLMCACVYVHVCVCECVCVCVCVCHTGPDQSCPDAEAFKEDMERTFAELRKLDEGQTWDETQFNNGADTLAHVLELVRLHHVTLPGHICAVVVTTLVLEGWSNKLDPTHSVLSQVGGLGLASGSRRPSAFLCVFVSSAQVQQGSKPACQHDS